MFYADELCCSTASAYRRNKTNSNPKSVFPATRETDSQRLQTLSLRFPTSVVLLTDSQGSGSHLREAKLSLLIYPLHHLSTLSSCRNETSNVQRRRLYLHKGILLIWLLNRYDCDLKSNNNKDNCKYCERNRIPAAV